MASCDTLRASGRIVVLASDLNIDTSEASSPYVPSCDAAINTVTFFDQLSSEPGFLSRSLLRTRKTTLRLTRLDEVVEDDDAGDAVAASSADAAVGSADADPEVAAMEAGIAAAAARSAALDRGAQGFEIYANAFDKIVLLTPQPQGITGILRRREESIPTPHTMASATQIQLLPAQPLVFLADDRRRPRCVGAPGPNQSGADAVDRRPPFTAGIAGRHTADQRPSSNQRNVLDPLIVMRAPLVIRQVQLDALRADAIHAAGYRIAAASRRAVSR